MNKELNTKRGKGRPAGSLTLQNVKMADLMEKFGPDTILPVGRLWLKSQSSQSFSPAASQPTPEPQLVAPVESNEPRIEFSLVD